MWTHCFWWSQWRCRPHSPTYFLSQLHPMPLSMLTATSPWSTSYVLLLVFLRNYYLVTSLLFCLFNCTMLWLSKIQCCQTLHFCLTRQWQMCLVSEGLHHMAWHCQLSFRQPRRRTDSVFVNTSCAVYYDNEKHVACLADVVGWQNNVKITTNIVCWQCETVWHGFKWLHWQDSSLTGHFADEMTRSQQMTCQQTGCQQNVQLLDYSLSI